MIGKLAEAYGASYCEARIFSVYGKYERAERLVPMVIGRLSKGEKVTIDRGDFVRDYLFAEDVADAVCHCLENRAEGVYNISSGEPVAIREIVLRAADLLGRRRLVEFCPDAEKEGRESHLIVGDNSKIRELGFKPRFSLEEGIAETLEWMKKSGRI